MPALLNSQVTSAVERMIKLTRVPGTTEHLSMPVCKPPSPSAATTDWQGVATIAAQNR